MLKITLSMAGKRRETLVDFLRHIADDLENNVSNNVNGLNVQSDDGMVLGVLVGEPISYSMVVVTDKYEKFIYSSHKYTSRSHCFSSCANAAIRIADDKGMTIGPDEKMHKVVRFVVEDNEGNTIFHRSPQLWVKEK
jgi:hypothetical protein